MTHGTPIICPGVPSFSFYLSFSFFICHKVFSSSLLWPPSPSCLSLTSQPSSLNSVVLFSFPSSDILPGCVAETSDLSRGTCGQHPCLLFSLFLLSSLPLFICPYLFLLLPGSLVYTSFPPSACFLHSFVPLWTSLFSLWFTALFLPLHHSVSPLSQQFNTRLFDLLLVSFFLC